MKNNTLPVAGIILAGGQSRRMNFFDKSQKKINNSTLMDIVLSRAKKQVKVLAINSNSKVFLKNQLEYRILPDCIEGSLGPLVGVLTGLEWLCSYKKIEWLVTFPVDTPFFPKNLVEKFSHNISKELIVVAKSNGRTHPAFAMWNIKIIDTLRRSIKQNLLKIDEFTKKINLKVVNFENIEYDPFFNINSEIDLLEAKKIYKYFEIGRN